MPSVESWLASIAFFGSSLVLGAALRLIVLPRLRAWSGRSRNLLDVILVDTLARPLPHWAVLAGLAAATQAAPLSEARLLVARKAVVGLFLLSLTVAFSRLASLGVREYARKLRGSEQTLGVVDHLVRAVIVILGGMLILSNLGISIAPLLGALGVGSLAVALALQDTLTNLFAGLHIVASELASVGDYIKLDSGQEGTVLDVGWRVTRLRDLGGNDVLLPNSKLANAIIVNFHSPSPDTEVVVPLAVAFGADLEKAERIVLEVGRALQKTVPGATRSHEPVMRLKAFGACEVQFNAILRTDNYAHRFRLIHEFLKGVHERFKAEGVEFPIPQTAVRLRQQG